MRDFLLNTVILDFMQPDDGMVFKTYLNTSGLDFLYGFKNGISSKKDRLNPSESECFRWIQKWHFF